MRYPIWSLFFYLSITPILKPIIKLCQVYSHFIGLSVFHEATHPHNDVIILSATCVGLASATNTNHGCVQWYITCWRNQMEIFLRYWPFVWGNHRSPVIFLHKGQWRGALMFSLICAWIYGWANNREFVDLRRHRDHDDVTVMSDVVWINLRQFAKRFYDTWCYHVKVIIR